MAYTPGLACFFRYVGASCLKPVPEEVYFASRVFTRGGQLEEDSAPKAGIGICVMG